MATDTSEYEAKKDEELKGLNEELESVELEIVELTTQLAEHPDDAGLYQKRGDLHLQRANLSLQIQALQSFIINPAIADMIKRAYHDNERAIELAPNDATAYYQQACVLSDFSYSRFELFLPPETQEKLDALDKERRRTFDEGDYKRSKHLEAVIKQEREKVIEPAQEQNDQRIIEYYTKALEYGYEPADSLYLERGGIYYRQGLMDEAIADYTKAASLGHLNGYIESARVHIIRGGISDALLYLRIYVKKVVEAFPDHTPAQAWIQTYRAYDDIVEYYLNQGEELYAIDTANAFFNRIRDECATIWFSKVVEMYMRILVYNLNRQPGQFADKSSVAFPLPEAMSKFVQTLPDRSREEVLNHLKHDLHYLDRGVHREYAPAIFPGINLSVPEEDKFEARMSIVNIKGLFFPNEACRARADLNYENGNFTSALVEYRQLIDKDTRDPDVYMLSGDCYRELKDASMAIAFYTTAIELAETDKQRGIIYGKRASAYEQEKEYQLAINDYTMAIRLDPASRQNTERERHRELCQKRLEGSTTA